MIPAHSSLKFQNDPNAFPGLVLELHTPLTGGIGPVAPTRDNSADLEYSGIIVDDTTVTLEFDPADSLVGFTALDQSGHQGGPTQIKNLLALCIGGEDDLIFNHSIPEWHDMWAPASMIAMTDEEVKSFIASERRLVAATIGPW
jgi:hypothetical protein